MDSSTETWKTIQIAKPLAGLLVACSVAVAMLTIATSAVAGPDCDDPKHANKPACTGGDDTGNEPLLFVVDLTGDVSGGGTDWESHSSKVIHYQSHWETATGVLILSFFFDEFGPGPSGERGESCFGQSGPLNAVRLEQERGGGALAMIWFEGFTADGITPVLYLLQLEGTLSDADDWLPASSNSMTMRAWSMAVSNEGRKVKNISCVGEGDFENEVKIGIVNIS